MKVIPKFQQGGGFAPFFTLYTSVEGSLLKSSPKSSGSSSEPKEPKKSSDGLLTLKDFFNMLKDIDGLPNEMNVIISGLIRDFQLLSLTGIPTEDLAVLYLSTLNKIKVAAQNKKTFDTLYLNALNESTLHEPAITPAGNLFVLDRETGKPVEVTLQEFLKNYKKYSILTNSNVAFFRSQAKAFAYDPNRLFDVISNGVSAETFQKALNTILVSLGHNKELIGLAYDEALAAEGAKVLLSMNPEERDEALNLIRNSGYKYNKSINSNEKLIMSLITYMNTVLPKRFKVWASVKTGIKDSNEASKALITEYLSSRGIKEVSEITNFDKDKVSEKNKGKGKDGNKSSTITINTATKWVAGMGDIKTIPIQIGTNLTTTVLSNVMPLVKMNGDYLGSNSNLELVTLGQYSSVLDLNNVSMGMNIINPAFFKQVILNDGLIYSIDYPSIDNNGVIMPDLSKETSENKIEADKVIKSKGINILNQRDRANNYLTINLIYIDHNLPAAYDAHGNLLSSTWKRFGVINAAATSTALEDKSLEGAYFGYNINKSYIKEIINDDLADNLVKIMQTYDKDYKSEGNIYQGTLWIPVNANVLTAMASEDLTISEVLDILDRESAKDLSAPVVIGERKLNL